MKKHEVILIQGDGIGPEISKAVQEIFHAAGAPISWTQKHAGVAALELGSEVLPQDTIDAMRSVKLALKGPCSTPIGKGFTSVNVQIRKALKLYAALRPVRSLEGVKTGTMTSISSSSGKTLRDSTRASKMRSPKVWLLP